jgi:hypothetical protein
LNLGHRRAALVSWFKARQPTVSRSPIDESALRESNPPNQLGRLEPLPLGQGHVKAEGGRVELPRHCCSTAFEAAAIANWLALPLIIQKLRWQESNLRRGG